MLDGQSEQAAPDCLKAICLARNEPAVLRRRTASSASTRSRSEEAGCRHSHVCVETRRFRVGLEGHRNMMSDIDYLRRRSAVRFAFLSHPSYARACFFHQIARFLSVQLATISMNFLLIDLIDSTTFGV